MIGQAGCLPKMEKQDLNFPASLSSEKSDVPSFVSKSVYPFAGSIIFMLKATMMQNFTILYNIILKAELECCVEKVSAKNSMNSKYFYIWGRGIAPKHYLNHSL